jgi:hypothetical protein
MTRMMILLSLLVACTSCSEFALLASGSSVAISQNVYAKAYSGVDVLTIIKTEKDIKTHVYQSFREENK